MPPFAPQGTREKGILCFLLVALSLMGRTAHRISGMGIAKQSSIPRI